MVAAEACSKRSPGAHLPEVKRPSHVAVHLSVGVQRGKVSVDLKACVHKKICKTRKKIPLQNFRKVKTDKN